MENNITLYIDISGSVSNFLEYWKQVSEFYAKNVDNIKTIWGWSNKITSIDKAMMTSIISKKVGSGGTMPQLIASNMVENSNIVIFTDGQVADADVAEVDRLLEHKEINNVTCYVISTSEPNLSVTCPFTRNNTSIVYYKKNTDLTFRTQSNAAIDYTLIHELDTISISDFTDKYEKIESLLIARNMGKTGDPATKELLLTMKQNLVTELKNRNTGDFGIRIRTALQENSIETAIKAAKEMTDAYFSSDIGMEIEKKVNYLISLCGDLRGKYTIDGIRSNHLARAEPMKIETNSITEIETQNLTDIPIECPIMMDTDVAQIMILIPDEPVLANLDKYIVDDITNCPLRILNYPIVITKLKKSISNYIGTRMGNLSTNPFTNQRILGTIPLGKCQQHVDCGNYTISRLFSSGKILGNIQLYYVVLWYLINNGEFEFLNDIKEQSKEHMLYRLTHSTTTASLCGLPQFVLTKIPTDIAMWYCINSCLLNQPTDRDTVRFHMFNLNVMIDVMKEYDYPISSAALKQINRLKVLLSMLSIVKRNEHDFRCRIRCLTQKGINVDKDLVSEKLVGAVEIVSYVPLDGKASDEQITEIINSFPTFYKKLSVDELIGLASMVDRQKSASDIVLSIDWIPNVTNYKICWEYGITNYDKNHFRICAATFRPYYKIAKEDGVEIWHEFVRRKYNVTGKLFSGPKLYFAYYARFKEFPNYDSFLLYCFERCHEDNLPFMTDKWIQHVIDIYEPIRLLITESEMTYEDVMIRYNASCRTVDRMRIESEWLAEY
ncbi:MAG: hypothetical protein Gaeavirus13_9 [Gaeavirus sp.]|uniref:Uncharacterized protein n=1 Tax=Gaeavirus sp. TaxID=2487767 RepID=A0A3G4ZZ29_9VIRU|nr:MAG: hypothetical protein Gaeavirus13_9 [Gaeavirus sp.]